MTAHTPPLAAGETPSLDEQIAYVHGFVQKHSPYVAAGIFGMEDAILASLTRLKAIDEAVMPEEPVIVGFMRLENDDWREVSPADQARAIRHIDALHLHAQKSAEAARVVREELADFRCIGVIDSNGDIYPEHPAVGTQIYISEKQS